MKPGPRTQSMGGVTRPYRPQTLRNNQPRSTTNIINHARIARGYTYRETAQRGCGWSLNHG